jgi:mono/diheme cytochrome c family protein
MKTLLCISIMAAATLPQCVLAAAGNAQKGQAVYTKSCKACHGAQGEGNPAIAKMLKVPIPDLASKPVQSKTDDELKSDIVKGKGKMQPVKTISAGEVQDVIAFLRTLAKK